MLNFYLTCFYSLSYHAKFLFYSKGRATHLVSTALIRIYLSYGVTSRRLYQITSGEVGLVEHRDKLGNRNILEVINRFKIYSKLWKADKNTSAISVKLNKYVSTSEMFLKSSY